MRKLLASLLFVALLVSIACWVVLSVWSYSATSKITTTDPRSLNDGNAAYLNVGLETSGQYDPKAGGIAVTILCGLAPDTQNAVKQATALGDGHDYDVAMYTNPVQYSTRKPISFEYPSQSGSSVNIRITARGYENIIAEAAQLANSYQVENQTEIKWTERSFLAPVDSYKVRLSFQMAVPPSMEIVSTSYSFSAGDLMPCKFYESHVDGNYSCTVKALSNNEIQLEFRRDSRYIWFLILPTLLIAISCLLALIGPTSRVRTYFSAAFSIVVTLVSLGVARSLAVPGAVAGVTLYDVVVLVSCVIALFAIVLRWRTAS